MPVWSVLASQSLVLSAGRVCRLGAKHSKTGTVVSLGYVPAASARVQTEQARQHGREAAEHAGDRDHVRRLAEQLRVNVTALALRKGFLAIGKELRATAVAAAGSAADAAARVKPRSSSSAVAVSAAAESGAARQSAKQA